MYISEIRIENFRGFAGGEYAFVLPLNPGLTALVGENDAGKTAVIDAIRLVLGTRDQDMLRVEPSDFHLAASGERAAQISIRLRFGGLTAADRGAFAEYLSFEKKTDVIETVLFVTWTAKRNKDDLSRRALPPEWRAGSKADGPVLDYGARSLLATTYLRPLRDAERAMSAGRGSRLSQILQHTPEIKLTGVSFDPQASPNQDPKSLSILGLGDYASWLFGESEGITRARSRLEEFLEPLSFADDPLTARIGVSGAQEDALRLRQLLEKLELVLIASADPGSSYGRGLGSNNLLFMACELLLLAAESEGFPLLLIEEPEAHLHPQRQMRLMSFLHAQSTMPRTDGQLVQIIVTTHSPNLASGLKLGNMALVQGGRGFSLSVGRTKLSGSDYRFLERFLDVTKANLLFARAVMIVEGDAENILLPAIARLLCRDFHHYGVSIVNVGGVGLGRYSRIFMRENEEMDGVVNIPVACITDMDVMPDMAPWIVGKLKEGEPIPERPPSQRQWRMTADFPGGKMEQRRKERREKASGQRVETFVADRWTLEYDLAYFGLAVPVWRAAALALADDRIQDGKVSRSRVINEADAAWKVLTDQDLCSETLASHVYARFEDDRASKAVAAQYLAEILEGTLSSKEKLRLSLPPYIVDAIAHVTAPFEDGPTLPP